MQERSPLASEVINLRIVKDKSKSVQMHLDSISEDCVRTGLQSSEEQTSRNISLNKAPRLWYGVKPLNLLEADCSIQPTGRFLLFISDLLICSLLFEYHIATPIATWQLKQHLSLRLRGNKEDGCCQWIPLYEVMCSHTKMLTCWLCAGVLQDIAIILGTYWWPFHFVFHVAWGILLRLCQNAWLYLTNSFFVIFWASFSICL